MFNTYALKRITSPSGKGRDSADSLHVPVPTAIAEFLDFGNE